MTPAGVVASPDAAPPSTAAPCTPAAAPSTAAPCTPREPRPPEQRFAAAARGPGWLPALAVSPFVLPRARALTDALVAPPREPGRPAVDSSCVERLARRLLRLGTQISGDEGEGAGARGAAGARVGSGPVVRIGSFELACAWTGHTPAGPPFRWHARAARRTIGLAAVRALWEGVAETPADAVALVLADPSGPAGVGRGGPGSCADWLVSLAPVARGVVGAEAATWATHLWTALEWARVGQADVGTPDRWWLAPGAAPIALRGRADVRLGRRGVAGAHLTMLDAHPTPAARTALVLSALVDALRGGPQAVPPRVVGWWPESGRAWVVEIDEAALSVAVDGVEEAVRAELSARSGARTETGGRL